MRSPDAWHELLVDVHQDLAGPGSSWFAQNLSYFPERTHSSKHKISTGPEFDPFCFWMFLAHHFHLSSFSHPFSSGEGVPAAVCLATRMFYDVSCGLSCLSLDETHQGALRLTLWNDDPEFLSAFSILLYPIFGLILGCKGTNACDSSGTRSCTFPGGGQCILLSASARKGHPLEAGSQRFAERPQLQPFAINVFDV